MKASLLALLLLHLSACAAFGAGRVLARPAIHSGGIQTLMLAKKKKVAKKKKATLETDSPSTTPAADMSADDDRPIEDRVAEVMRQRGITTNDAGVFSQTQNDANASPLSMLPAKGQELLERFFG